MYVAVKYSPLREGGFGLYVRRILRNPATKSLLLTEWQLEQIYESRDAAKSVYRMKQSDIARLTRNPTPELREILHLAATLEAVDADVQG